MPPLKEAVFYTKIPCGHVQSTLLDSKQSFDLPFKKSRQQQDLVCAIGVFKKWESMMVVVAVLVLLQGAIS